MKSESCYVCEYAKHEINRGLKEVRCNLHNRLVAYPNLGCVHCKKTCITNADRIRQMTDEELAEWIDTLKYNCCDQKCGDCCISGYEDTEGVCDVLSWLKQEVQDDD